MFTIYAEKEIFEKIIIYNEESPNWFKIFCNHADICLNITDQELDAEIDDETPISIFVNLTGGKRPIALKPFFDSIYDDNSLITDKPRSAFFLNYDTITTELLQKNYGVVVQSAQNIEDNILKGTYYRDLPKDKTFEDHKNKGWKNLVSIPLPPSNALVITDDFLFADEERGETVGKSNLIQLVDAFLPPTLKIDFHLTVFANDNNKSQEWCEKLTSELQSAISALRPYSIIFEVVFTKTIHKRRLMLNYINSVCDKGFAVFKVKDNKTVRSKNDFRCDRIFNRIEPHEGDTDFKSIESDLIDLKSNYRSIAAYINNRGATQNFRILGNHNNDMSLINRLLNDV